MVLVADVLANCFVSTLTWVKARLKPYERGGRVRVQLVA